MVQFCEIRECSSLQSNLKSLKGKFLRLLIHRWSDGPVHGKQCFVALFHVSSVSVPCPGHRPFTTEKAEQGANLGLEDSLTLSY